MFTRKMFQQTGCWFHLDIFCQRVVYIYEFRADMIFPESHKSRIISNRNAQKAILIRKIYWAFNVWYLSESQQR